MSSLQQENSLSHSLHSYGFIKIFPDFLLHENDLAHFLHLVGFLFIITDSSSGSVSRQVLATFLAMLLFLLDYFSIRN